MKIAICEPNFELSGKIEANLIEAGKLLPEKPDIEVYSSGEDFLSGLTENETFSIVYMNLEMGDNDGVNLGKKLRESYDSHETLLIYLSSSSSFGAQIFEVQPFLVIQLPFEKKDFMRRFFQAAESLQKADELYTCKKGGVIFQAKKRDVICIESDGRDLILSVSGREDVRYRGALKAEKEKLCTVNFVQPHASFIVNLDFVEEYRSETLLMRNKLIIPISELRMREFKQSVLKFWEYRNI